MTELMTSRERAHRIAVATRDLVVDDRVIVTGALFGFGPFEEALAQHPDIATCGSFIDIVEDIEMGVAVPPSLVEARNAISAAIAKRESPALATQY
jgi:hypothetical protein